ncbi:heavy metal-associated isoprenylated plant protein 26 [Populus alba]|uniref:heavy metal-associated isoprenylated plant protein 26 n=1 Tax=Populus alba TaxID=43335 RepID=UPI00158B5DC5|nr:heavy metal-associated isoprenylated plant protein 26-like [Populus alba]
MSVKNFPSLSHTFQIPLALFCALILYIFYILPASRVPLSFSRIKKSYKEMGVLDHMSGIFDCSRGSSRHRKYRQLQTVEVKVRLDCEGCERKVKRSLEGMKGVSQVLVDRKSNKVTVVGYVEPARVLARVAHRTGKKAELWPYVPYDTVAHPYTAGVYDKKAPAGYVRSNQDPQVSQFARASSFEVRYTTAFSDENPTACAVM